MLVDFFYHLRTQKLKVSVKEYLTLAGRVNAGFGAWKMAPEEAVAFAARCAQFAQACQELRVTHKVFRQNTVAAQCRC